MLEISINPVAGGVYGLYDWATHIPVLVTALTHGKPKTVLELGAGSYSTGIIHAYCRGTKVKATSLENDFNPGYLQGLQWMATANHEIVKVKDWESLPVGPYDLVMIDQGPEEARIPSAAFYQDKCDLMIIHDCNYRNRYIATLAQFKYIVYDRTHKFHTALCSNSADIRKWFEGEAGVSELPMWPEASINC